MKNYIKYKSQDNITEINAVIWTPTVPIKAIVQISHGMIEHIERYDEFANFLNTNGILVCGNDHLGHGSSIMDNNPQGYFAKKDAQNILIEDLYSLTKILKKDYPNVPYFLLGHSMGSFIARNYLAKYSSVLNGALILGTGYQNNFKLNLAIILSYITQFYHRGWFYRSPMLENLTIGKYHKFFPEKDRHCWLTTDKNKKDNYNRDIKTNFKFTCNAYLTLFRLIKMTNNKKNIKNINNDLPIILLSGKDDPVGNFGKDIYKINDIYKKRGLKNIKMKLYNNMRHEIINEHDRIIVYNDILNFINNNI